MQWMTKQDLASLLTETSHALAVEDLDDVLALDALADVVVNGVQSDDDDLLAMPFIVGGIAFWPMSLAKIIYWRDVLSSAFDGDEVLTSAAMLWICSQRNFSPSDQPETADPRAMRKTITKWAKHCPLSESQIMRVMGEYCDGDETKSGATNANKYGQLIALLIREFGQSWQYWISAPLDEIRACLAEWTARVEAEAASIRRSAAKGGKPIPPTPSPKIKALQAYRIAKNELRDKWQPKVSK